MCLRAPCQYDIPFIEHHETTQILDQKAGASIIPEAAQRKNNLAGIMALNIADSNMFISFRHFKRNVHHHFHTVDESVFVHAELRMVVRILHVLPGVSDPDHRIG